MSEQHGYTPRIAGRIECVPGDRWRWSVSVDGGLPWDGARYAPTESEARTLCSGLASRLAPLFHDPPVSLVSWGESAPMSG